MEEALKQSNMPFAAGKSSKAPSSKSAPRKSSWTSATRAKASFPATEFDDIKAVKVGDEIDVLIEKLEDKEGMVVLSSEKAEFKKNWERILTICNEGGTITGKVKAVVKGGLLVNIGVEAFLPASQIDVITPKNLAAIRRQHLRIQGRQDQPGTAEHRSFPPRTDRTGTHRTPPEAAHRNDARATSARARSRTSPTSARSLTSTALTACCTSPT